MKLIIDLDGTLLHNRCANADAVAFMRELRRRQVELVVMTNSIKSPAGIVDRLRKADIEVELANILNPIHSINTYLNRHGYKKVYIVGSEPEREQVKADCTAENPQLVILLDFEKKNVAYNELQKIFLFMQEGIPVVSASGSVFYNTENGKCLDTGAFVRLFEAAADVSIQILGKPPAEYFEAGIALLGAQNSDVLVIGDDWRTDIVGAQNVGCRSVLVRTGKYAAGDENRCQATYVINNLMELFETIPF